MNLKCTDTRWYTPLCAMLPGQSFTASSRAQDLEARWNVHPYRSSQHPQVAAGHISIMSSPAQATAQKTLCHMQAQMSAEADAFIGIPGGFGTLEELLEMVTWQQLGLHTKPVGVLNMRGYFDHLLDFFDHAVEEVGAPGVFAVSAGAAPDACRASAVGGDGGLAAAELAPLTHVHAVHPGLLCPPP